MFKYIIAWLSGYLAQRHCYQRHLGALYGFLAWCVALLAIVVIGSHVQQYISFYGHFLSGDHHLVQIASNPASNTVSINAHSEGIIVSTYIIFCLFFLSAFACCLGGHCGMRYIYKK